MDEIQKRELAITFIKSQLYAVISTIWEGAPQAATVAFTELEDFALLFATNNFTRKFRNLKANPRVAVVIGWDEAITIQLEGNAVVLTGTERTSCQACHFEKHPSSKDYVTETEEYIKVIPNWLRYTDISQDPEFSFEFTVFTKES